jgi:hypothetical protein
MKHLVLLVFVIFSYFFQGLSQKVIRTWSNGQKKVTYKIYSGDTLNMINVLYKAYYPNGQVFKIGSIKNGLETGIWRYFYQSGKLKSRGQFSNGLNDGLFEVYYESGEIEQKGNFKQGKLVNISFYNKNGIIKDKNENLRKLLINDSKKWTIDQLNEIKNDCIMAIEPSYDNAEVFCNCVVQLISNHCNFRNFKQLTENQRGIVLDYLTTGKDNCWTLLQRKKK